MWRFVVEAAENPACWDDIVFDETMWQEEPDDVGAETYAFDGMQVSPRLPLPRISGHLLELIFSSYDIEGDGFWSRDAVKAFVRDLRCVECLTLSQQEEGAIDDAHAEMCVLAGVDVARAMSGAVSKLIGARIQRAHLDARAEVRDEIVDEFVVALDADRDGLVSQSDFLANARAGVFAHAHRRESASEVADAMRTIVQSGPLTLSCASGDCYVVEAKPMLTNPSGECMRAARSYARGSSNVDTRTPSESERLAYTDIGPLGRTMHLGPRFGAP